MSYATDEVWTKVVNDLMRVGVTDDVELALQRLANAGWSPSQIRERQTADAWNWDGLSDASVPFSDWLGAQGDKAVLAIGEGVPEVIVYVDKSTCAVYRYVPEKEKL